MSKKALLEEGSVRQFMRLANLKPLAEDFVTDLYKEELEEEEKKDEVNEIADEEVSEEVAKEEITEEEMGMPPDVDAVADEDDEMAPDLDAVVDDEMSATADLGDKEGLLKDVVSAVAAVLGVEVSMDSTDAAEETPADLDVDAETEMELADTPVEGEVYQESNLDLDSIVAEVTKRVKERLAAKK